MPPKDILNWDQVAPIMGVWSDSSIARVYDVTPQTVREQRVKRGIAPYPPEALAKDAGDRKRERAHALRKAVLAALWPRQGTRPEECWRRVCESYMTVGKSTVQNILVELVTRGYAARVLDGPQTTYTRVKEL